jgi:hypothetical protein
MEKTVKRVTVDQNSLQWRALVLASCILGFFCRHEMSCWHAQYVDRFYGIVSMQHKFNWEVGHVSCLRRVLRINSLHNFQLVSLRCVWYAD